jgi:hypothetical protein
MERRAGRARRSTPKCETRMTRSMGWVSILSAAGRSPFGQENWTLTVEPSISLLRGVGRIWRQSNTDWRSSGFGSIARVQVIIGEIRRIRRRLGVFSLKIDLPSVENPSGFFRLVSRIRLANVVSVQEMLLQMRRRGKGLRCLWKWRRLRLFTVLGCGLISADPEAS